MARTKFRSLRRSVARGKRSRKPKDNPNSKKELNEDYTPSAKKLRLGDESSSQTSSKESFNRPTGYRFQDVDILRRVILASAVCKECLQGTLQLFEKVSGCGLARTLVLQCANNRCKAFTELPTSERIIRGKARFYDVNRRSALAMRIIGRGRAALTKFCAVMNMPSPVAKKSFQTHVKAIARVSQQVAEAEMKKAANEIRAAAKAGNDENLDIAVSCDGTWARRGFQSLYGMVSAIHVDTGKVVDYEMKSKVCFKCRAKKDLDPTSQEYIEWMETHAPKCSANFNKSSKAMESQGAVDIWGRSVQKHKLRYVDFVGDGDCSSHRDVVKSKPYGAEVVVRKVECIGHIQKRMGGRLRRKKKDLKGKKLADGKTIGGRNRLTDNLIDTFQRYYGKALRQNKGDLPGMEKAVKAIWHHYASTEDNPSHDFCPEGPDSWCKWQRDQANGTETFRPKNVASAVMQEILPTFEALWDRNLLQSVLEGLSQNNNEALNHLVWDISPKELFGGPETVLAACAIGVCLFNGGARTLQTMLRGLHLAVGEHCKSGLAAIDKQRLYAAAEKASEATKQQRQIRRSQRKSRNERNEEQEGPTYEPGAFGL